MTMHIEEAWMGKAPLPGVLEDALAASGVGRYLHYSGPLTLLEGTAPRVALIGTREPSPETAAAMEALAGQLAGAGALVISGAARGTDMAAHRGALGLGRPTVAVVPQGLETLDWNAWRPDFRDLARPELLLLLSPFFRDQAITRQTPVIRNRLIAALSEVVVAGEAALDSGTHHCTRFARQLGRPLFFLKGVEKANDALALAHQGLVQSGARPFTCDDALGLRLADEILEAATAFRREQTRQVHAQLRLFDV